MSWKHEEKFTLILVIISSINLSLQNPLLDASSTLVIVSNYIDIITTVIFSVEIMVKVIWKGFLFNGKDSFLRSTDNFIDFCSVVGSIITLSTLFTNKNLHETLKGTSVKMFRLWRLTRVFLIIKFNKGMKIAVNCLFNALPGFLNLLLLLFTCLLIFSVMGVNFFKGTFATCDIA